MGLTNNRRYCGDRMKFTRFGFLFLLAIAAASAAHAQPQSGENYRSLLTARVRTQTLPPSSHLNAYIQDGKLRLSLRDAILLALENNSEIQIEETQIEANKFSLLAAFQPFDPLLQSSLNVNRSSNPSYYQLQGVGQTGTGVLNDLNQIGQVSYTQMFTSGTNVQATIFSGRTSTNSSYYFFNPYYSSSLNVQFTQPLLRNRGRFANTAQIKIARKALSQSRWSFEADVNDLIQQVVIQYWAAVQAHGALDVQNRSVDLADVSFKRDKRALELGALPPLDISRSESEVAARRVQQVQTAYALQQAEEALRFTIGADQDAQIHTLALDLTESPEPTGELQTTLLDAALAQALNQRPEVAAAGDALAGDDLSIRLAHNQLKPDLSINGFYQSNGLGGNQYDLTTGQLTSPGGFRSSFGQLFGFGFPGYGGTLTLNLPVRNRAGQARLGNALVSKTRDLYSRQQVQEFITRQVRDAVNQLDAARLSLSVANTSFDLAKKSLAADQRKFELGSETNFFVLDSQQRLAQAELALLQARVNYQVALAAISHATGDLIGPYHLQIEAASK
jgi:outer membrane protein TolC